MTRREFDDVLRQYRNILPKQTIKTLRGQAFSGDVDGAKRGLEKVIRRYRRDYQKNVFKQAHALARKLKALDGTRTYAECLSKGLRIVYREYVRL